MSAIVCIRFKLDTDKFERILNERKADLVAIAEDAKSKGALHHRFAIGDGEVFVIDEWKSAEAFQKFFDAQTLIPELLEQAGLQGPPEVTALRPAESADQF